jgi:DNA anti-recombination protein RmuC
MTKTRIGMVILTAMVLGAFVCGCQEEQTSNAAPDTKESRLVGAENVQLKSQIEALKKQIETLQGQLEKETQLATTCDQRIRVILEQAAQERSQLASDMEQDKKQSISKLLQDKEKQIAQIEQDQQKQLDQMVKDAQAQLKACEEKTTEMMGISSEHTGELTAQIAALQAEIEKLKGTKSKTAK